MTLRKCRFLSKLTRSMASLFSSLSTGMQQRTSYCHNFPIWEKLFSIYGPIPTQNRSHRKSCRGVSLCLTAGASYTYKFTDFRHLGTKPGEQWNNRSRLTILPIYVVRMSGLLYFKFFRYLTIIHTLILYHALHNLSPEDIMIITSIEQLDKQNTIYCGKW